MQLFAVVCRFSLWNSAGCVRLWLEGLSKEGLFGCQSTFAISFCQRHCVSLCKSTKAPEFGLAEFWDGLPVSVLECFLVFGTRRAVSGFGLGLLVCSGFFDAKAGFGGFGLGLLVSSGFWGAKAPLDPVRRAFLI